MHPSPPSTMRAVALPAPAVGNVARSPMDRLFWPFQCVYWLMVVGFNVGFGQAVSPTIPIAWNTIAFRTGTGFLVTAGVHWLFQQPRLRRIQGPFRWLLIFLATSCLLVGSLIPLGLLGNVNQIMWLSPNFSSQILPRIAASIFWCTGYFAIEVLDGLYASEIRLARAEAEAARREARAMQLEAIAYDHEVQRLQAQMNPHFLFNALNAVIACKHSPDDVARVTQDLADFLRSALRDSRLLEPLSREVKALEKYLAVQQARFGSKLDCRIICDRAARGVMVPPMMIQPLLENAIAYGMQTSDDPLRVEVSARVNAGWLEVVVANSGSWITPDPERSPGTGLKTLRKRLALLIGTEAVLEVKTPAEDQRTGTWAGVEVVIRVPIERSAEQQPAVELHQQDSPA